MPTAALTVEDAAGFLRLFPRGHHLERADLGRAVLLDVGNHQLPKHRRGLSGESALSVRRYCRNRALTDEICCGVLASISPDHSSQASDSTSSTLLLHGRDRDPRPLRRGRLPADPAPLDDLPRVQGLADQRPLGRQPIRTCGRSKRRWRCRSAVARREVAAGSLACVGSSLAIIVVRSSASETV